MVLHRRLPRVHASGVGAPGVCEDTQVLARPTLRVGEIIDSDVTVGLDPESLESRRRNARKFIYGTARLRRVATRGFRR